jgi:hypothetical protein
MRENLISFLRFMRSTTTLFTVVVPASAYGDNGVRYLCDLLHSISLQDIPVRIVITDHSENFAIKNYLEAANHSNVYYFRNSFGKKNWCRNTNVGLKIARFGKSPFIKIMFQDDIFIDRQAFQGIISAFEKQPDKGWLCHASSHFLDPGEEIDFSSKLQLVETRKMVIPKFTPRLLFLENEISCPSAITFRVNSTVKFDPNILLGGDCDFYWALGLEFGEPILLSDNYTANREHEFSITHGFHTNSSPGKKRFFDGRKVRSRKDLLIWEIEYMERKYKYRYPFIQTLPSRVLRVAENLKRRIFAHA